MDVTRYDLLGALNSPMEVEGFLPIGSWRVNVRANRRTYAETLGSLLRQEIGRRPLAADVEATVSLLGTPAEGPLFGGRAGAPESAVARWQTVDDGVRVLFTGWFLTVVMQNQHPHQIVVFIREPQYSERAFRDHLFETLCKILFLYDRFYVHAGAVEFADKVNLFVGPGGHGKSTICLRLAQEGATILSEDHVIFRRNPADGSCFWVSGCQETARVTPRTEDMVFASSLLRAAVDGPGGPKKEFQVAEYFPAEPYRDRPFHRLFFNRVGSRFRIEAISRQAAMLRLIYMTRSFFRHDDEGDLASYLSFFGDLVLGRQCYDLELAPDLAALDELVAFLGPHRATP